MGDRDRSHTPEEAMMNLSENVGSRDFALRSNPSIRTQRTEKTLVSLDNAPLADRGKIGIISRDSKAEFALGKGGVKMNTMSRTTLTDNMPGANMITSATTTTNTNTNPNPNGWSGITTTTTTTLTGTNTNATGAGWDVSSGVLLGEPKIIDNVIRIDNPRVMKASHRSRRVQRTGRGRRTGGTARRSWWEKMVRKLRRVTAWI